MRLPPHSPRQADIPLNCAHVRLNWAPVIQGEEGSTSMQQGDCRRKVESLVLETTHSSRSLSDEPLPSPVLERMENLFGTCFGHIRVHVGLEALTIGARAFACGPDLHFAPGEYRPHTRDG